MPFSALVAGDVKLEKDAIVSIVPGHPGYPGAPGTPTTPAYDSFETRYFPTAPPPVGFTYDLDSAGNPTIVPEVWFTGWYSELGEWKTTLLTTGHAPGSAYIATIHHAAIAGTPDSPGIPPVASQTLIDNNIGWNSIGTLDAFIQEDGTASFYPSITTAGAVVGLSFYGAFALDNGDGTGGVLGGVSPSGGGLTSVLSKTSPFGIEHAFYLQRGSLKIMENGSVVFDAGTYVESDLLMLKLSIGHQIRYYKNGALIYTSLLPATYAVLSLIALFYAAGDKILNATMVQSNFIRSFGRLAPLGNRNGGKLPELRLLNSGALNLIRSAGKFAPIFGVAADKKRYAYSTGRLAAPRGYGENGTPKPIYNVGYGFVSQLTGFGIGVVPRRASSYGFIAPARSHSSDIAAYSYSAGQFVALRARTTLPFLHLMIASSLGASASMSSAFRLVALVDATGAVSMIFTVNIGSLGTIASKLGISSAFSVKALMYALIASRMGVTSAPLELHATDGLLDVWVVNTESNATTRYEQFDFNSFALIDGQYFGARDDGIYLLEGDTDAGIPIRASINFGKQNFGTSKEKRVPNAYIGTASSGLLVMKVVVEGSEYLYTARADSADLSTQRFDFGKGLKANFFEFELYNGAGEDFDLESVEFVSVQLSRRI